MENKQKQIEELAKDRVAELRLFYNFCEYNGCEEKTAEDCENCYFRKVYNRLAELEGEIRNGTLKEIPENAVVLTREEFSEKIENTWLNCQEFTRKETAEKFAGIAKGAFFGVNCITFDEWNWYHDKLDEICKEITDKGVQNGD